MSAPRQAFPSEDNVPQGDVDPASYSITGTAHGPPSLAPGVGYFPTSPYSFGLSGCAIAGIVTPRVVSIIVVSAFLFLLGQHRIIFQFISKEHYQLPGPQHHPGIQGLTSPLQMVSLPHH